MKNHSPFMCCGMYAVLLGLFLVVAAQGAEETRDFKTLVMEWLPGKKYPTIDSRDLRQLTAEQRAELAVAAARDLSWRTTNGVFITPELYAASRHPDTYRSEASRPIREQTAVNSFRLGTIHMLIQDGKVYDARLIPHLIEMLEFPNAYQTVTGDLELLTGRRIGFERPRRPDPEAEQEQRCEVAEWWRAWWGKNHDRHPVLDPALRHKLGQRQDQAVNQLIQDLGEHTVLNRLKQSSGGSYRFGNSELEAGGSSPPPLLILMEAKFGTLTPEGARRYDIALGYNPEPLNLMSYFEKRHGPMAECLREEVPGTDILITVRAASPDKDYLRRLRESLARLPKMGE